MARGQPAVYIPPSIPPDNCALMANKDLIILAVLVGAGVVLAVLFARLFFGDLGARVRTALVGGGRS